MLRYEDCRRRSQACKKHRGEPDEVIYRIDGGKRLLSGKPADDCSVSRGIELLKQASGNDGQHEQHKHFTDGAFCQVITSLLQ